MGAALTPGVGWPLTTPSTNVAALVPDHNVDAAWFVTHALFALERLARDASSSLGGRGLPLVDALTQLGIKRCRRLNLDLGSNCPRVLRLGLG